MWELAELSPSIDLLNMWYPEICSVDWQHTSIHADHLSELEIQLHSEKLRFPTFIILFISSQAKCLKHDLKPFLCTMNNKSMLSSILH